MLFFKKSSKELNELSRTFNKVAKTIQIARNALDVGEDAQAMLNYHEAFNIFSDFKNLREQGVCFNNIGAIFMRSHEFIKAFKYFDRATQMQLDLKATNKNFSTADSFLLACRWY